MKIPKRLQPLVDDGLIDAVYSRLMSGKEADVFVVGCAGEVRCAKVYKDAVKRSFKKAAQYQEGRKVRGGRQARAMGKRSSYGRQLEEEIWQNAEVDALSRLAKVGVRVPQTYWCIDGVLLMELVCDSEGDVAPQLGEVSMSAEQAVKQHAMMIENIKLMLCAGLIHGDLSEFNVLVDENGPVVIDLPQAVNAAANNSAQAMFARDVNNMRRYYSEYAPQLKQTQYAKEIWALFEEANLTPHSQLTGQFNDVEKEANVDSVLDEIYAAELEEFERKERMSDDTD
ncbi:serine protein kinase RIO [Pseudoalteromonas sp. MMG010]|uniref:PA4780 family RIO1-like protein kinase n=1 Tax=Pseudoalteromonas sp. MMG010 TaxID=2822685 RepID=UPI001B3A76DB|nr:PA4780 family RIO1-like protein kinase [Pseudoalteromonas sp. MMG010]MBQ4833806.1 serine protein kinase RIO [Pseudoalteromonas sp. MMG010]